MSNTALAVAANRYEACRSSSTNASKRQPFFGRRVRAGARLADIAAEYDVNRKTIRLRLDAAELAEAERSPASGPASAASGPLGRAAADNSVQAKQAVKLKVVTRANASKFKVASMEETSPGRERQVDPAREASVVVVGSLNLDIVVPVPRHPAPGETVLGDDHFANAGGKGANQAAAAARLGQRVAMVGRVGEDEAGQRLVESLEQDGVDTRCVFGTADAPTGLALIAVDPSGENSIIVSPGANGRLSAVDVASARALLASARVTLLQLEVPLEATVEAARLGGGTIVLNPAPARPLPAELLEAIDVLVPNRGELADLVGSNPPETLEETMALARRIEGPRSVVVTLGAGGAVLVDGEHTHHVPAPEVNAVDTTAAGDSFCGALADALERNASLDAAIAWAVCVAAVTVTRRGAQSSLPTRAGVARLV